MVEATNALPGEVIGPVIVGVGTAPDATIGTTASSPDTMVRSSAGRSGATLLRVSPMSKDHTRPVSNGSTFSGRDGRGDLRSASDDASFVNGSVYIVDDGAHAGNQVGLMGADCGSVTVRSRSCIAASSGRQV